VMKYTEGNAHVSDTLFLYFERIEGHFSISCESARKNPLDAFPYIFIG